VVAGAGLLTLFILAGLGVVAWAALQPPASSALDTALPPAAATTTVGPASSQRIPDGPAKPIAEVQESPDAANDESAGPYPNAAAFSPEPAPLPSPAAPATFAEAPSSPADCQSYGTSVKFLGSPAEAARLAAQQQKIQFVLHISGNFEDSKFT
jgi:hypothetical protein